MTGEILIAGSGIMGLWTGLVLARKGLAASTVIIAKHLPGDASIEYVSPVAGAHWSSRVIGPNAQELRWNKISFRLLEQLFEEYGEEAGLLRTLELEFWAEKAPSKLVTDTMREIAPDFTVLSDSEFLRKHGAVYGHRFLAYNFNSPKFLRFVQRKLTEEGVTFIRRTLTDINEGFNIFPGTRAVFNCCGLGVTKLSGVNDSQPNYPVRGQALLVRAPHIKENVGLDLGGGESSYIVPRPFTDGLVIVGGSREEGNYSADALWSQSSAILDSALRFWPDLAKAGSFEVIGPTVGLRPGRRSGPRLEKVHLPTGNIIIHCYGVSGAGYQMGLAMAVDAVALLEKNSTSLSKL